MVVVISGSGAVLIQFGRSVGSKDMKRGCCSCFRRHNPDDVSLLMISICVRIKLLQLSSYLQQFSVVVIVLIVVKKIPQNSEIFFTSPEKRLNTVDADC